MFYPDVLHRMCIKGEPARVRAALDYIKGCPGDNELFDLNTLIPMPECIQVTAEREGLGTIIEAYGQSEVKAYQERCAASERQCLAETGFSGWFDWCLSQWDTPWNVYAVAWSDAPDTLFFRSAGSTPYGPLLELSNIFPDVVIHVDYSDECGNSLGHAIFAAGDGCDEHFAPSSAAGQEVWEGLRDFASMNTQGCISKCDEEDEWPSIIYVD